MPSVHRPSRAFKSESQVLLENFMEKFVQNAGSQENHREAKGMKDMVETPRRVIEVGEK